MMVKELISKTRSYRRFDQSYFIDIGILEDLIDLARLSASTANRQPLKYILYNSPDHCDRIFPAVTWAAYLKEWKGPVQGERPSAYIIMLGDKTITGLFNFDAGIAAQSIMIGATEAGLGGCMISSVKREMLRAEFKIPERFEILLILALGKPAENVIIDDIKDGDVRYWRDSNGDHHVPKRTLDELIIKV